MKHKNITLPKNIPETQKHNYICVKNISEITDIFFVISNKNTILSVQNKSNYLKYSSKELLLKKIKAGKIYITQKH